ncbi:hypothetical protein [Lacisediminihabitans profunda]|uniref:Glycosyltransferase RgtA/B/C/D-like domain-containing protein n=1 Tax=Lacisediminihabitans profunda TaxID=2594790 RepID=A0A5C8UJH6_9MICO|nr:hypothetical protein [Lacisediminihabitans profunda]TXN28216.1 hypothetical protein FVP33_17205 [Lacisediminihabitans profunda]
MQQIIPVSVFCILSVLSVAAIAWRSEIGVAVRTPMLVGYGARIVAALGVWVVAGLFAPDAIHYDNSALQIVDAWHGSGALPALGAGKEAFPLLLAALYAVAGHIPALGIILNVTASTVAIPVIAATAKRFGGSPKTGAWIASAFPPFLLWGGMLLRESLTWLLLAVIVWSFACLVDRFFDWHTLLISASSLAALLWVRGSAALIVGAAAAGALVFARKVNIAVRIAVPIVIAALAALVLFGGIKVIGGYSANLLATGQSLLAHSARTGNFPAIQVADPVSAVGTLGLLVPKVLFGPLPWEWSSVGVAFAIDAIVWILLLWLVFMGWRQSKHRRRLLVALIPASALLLALIVSSGNYGTMQRLRVQAAVMIIPIAVLPVRRVGVKEPANVALPLDRAPS